MAHGEQHVVLGGGKFCCLTELKTIETIEMA